MSSPLRVEPGVFGICKPVLLLPEGITHHLTQTQLRLVLAHEICHVWRRDNLTGAIHMMVEAMFWFYPLLWWIRARLVEERERACDEEVCSQGCEPEIYAEGILKVCQFFLESPLICTAGITGANLKRRVESIMTRPIIDKLSFGKKLAMATVGVSAVILPIVAGIVNAPPVQAQSSASRPQFEVASIKPSKGQDYMGLAPHPGGYMTANGPLSFLIETAYGVKRTQIVGGPAWMDSEQYQIAARADSNLSEKQMGLALQVLLENRFKMKIRRESKDVKIYALTIGKNGIRQQSISTGTCSLSDPNQPPPAPSLNQRLCPPTGVVRLTNYKGFAWLQGKAVSTRQLVERLSYFLDRPIVDNTGYEGALDVDLQFATDYGVRFPGSPMTSFASPPDESRPSVFAALQEQLGLRLESAKGTVDLLVIDQVNRPSPN
jgi:uncharacterized protein (TIGR03435 family)